MKILKVLLIVIFSSVFLASCEDDELTPNEEAAKSQQAGIDLLNQQGSGNNGGGSGGGSGGSGGGGGSNIVESFNATVDGVSISSTDPFFQSSIFDQIVSTASSTNDLFLINIFGGLSEKTIDNPTISYFVDPTTAYEAFNGQLVLVSVTSEVIEGTFFFNAENASISDTISVTGGTFKVKR